MTAALELVREAGLGAVATTLSYQVVFSHLLKTRGIRVPRASVHERIWDSQDDFRLEALAAATLRTSAAEGSAIEPALGIFAGTEGLAPLQRLREMTRVAAEITQTTADQDPLYYSWVGMTMAMAKDPSIDRKRRDFLEEAVPLLYGDHHTGHGRAPDPGQGARRPAAIRPFH